MKVAYYCAAASLALGDRRLQRAAPAGAFEAHRGRGRASRAASGAPRRPTSRSTTSATIPRRTAGSSRRCAAARRRRACTSSCSTTSSRGSRSRAATRAGYLDAMERDHGLAGRLLAYGVLDNRIPPLWETRPQDFPLAGEVLRRADALIVHSRVRRGSRAGGRLRRADLADPASGLAGAGRPCRRRRGRAADRLLRPPEREQAASRSCYAAFARLRERHPERRPPRRRLCDASGGRARAARRAWSARTTSTRRGSGRSMAACDVVVSLRSPTMGETSGSVVRALSLGTPARRLRRRLVLGAAGRRRRSRCAPDEREVDAPRGGARAARRRRRRCARRWALAARDARASGARRSTRVAELYAGRARGGGRRRRRPGRGAPRGRRGGGGDRASPPTTPRPRELAARLRRGRAWRVRRRPSARDAPLDRPRSPGLGLADRHRRRRRRSSATSSGAARRRPWIMVDELIYSELAKSFADSGPLPRPRRGDGRLRRSSTRC